MNAGVSVLVARSSVKLIFARRCSANSSGGHT